MTLVRFVMPTREAASLFRTAFAMVDEFQESAMQLNINVWKKRRKISHRK